MMTPIYGRTQTAIELADLNREQRLPELFGLNLLRQDYQNIVKQLKTGDTISYNGQIFNLGDYLGGDSATRIFAISSTKAIRIGRDGFSTMLSHNYLEAYKKLKFGGESVVKVFESESKPEFNFIIVERLTPQFDLSEFATRYDKIKYRTPEDPSFTMNPERKILARNADPTLIIFQLKKFVRDLAKFSEIGDYNNTQVIWDGKRFVLVDWAWATHFAQNASDRNSVIDSLKGRSSINESLIKALNDIVQKERRSLPNKCSGIFEN